MTDVVKIEEKALVYNWKRHKCAPDISPRLPTDEHIT